MERNPSHVAADNLAALRNNPYPGRGIIVGLDETGQYIIQAYWIMGRSENSRNRFFITDEDYGRVKTAIIDLTKVKDTSLIVYTAMAEAHLKYVVSNGHQTLPVLNGKPGSDLNKLLLPWSYEPDNPNFTPRITAMIDLHCEDDVIAEFGILSKSSLSEKCERSIYNMPLKQPGLGYCVTTYSGDGDPLPPFEDAPYLMPLYGNISDITKILWHALNEDNKISLAVKFIDTKTGTSHIQITNKYSQETTEA
jgi:hypothetical protein